MKITITYLAVIILLAAVCVLAIKECNDRKGGVVEKTFTQHQIDSVARLYIESDSVVRDLVLRNSHQVATNDSLKLIAKNVADSLTLKALQLRVAAKDVQLSRRKIKDLESGGEDFIDFVNKCDSLALEADRQANLADRYMSESRLIQMSYDSLLGTTSLRVARLEFDRDFLQEKFDTVAAHALILERDRAKFEKKARKRFVLGIGGGYGIGPDGKAGFIGGPVLVYKIAQF